MWWERAGRTCTKWMEPRIAVPPLSLCPFALPGRIDGRWGLCNSLFTCAQPEIRSLPPPLALAFAPLCRCDDDPPSALSSPPKK